METTIVYDTYVKSNNRDGNYGRSTIIEVSKYGYGGSDSSPVISHGIYYWDISMSDLTKLELKIYIDRFNTHLLYYANSSSGSERIDVENLTFKFDLYSLASMVNEETVTWNNVPKTELIKKDFIAVPANNIPGNQSITLDLTPYASEVKNGVMLKMNDFIDIDVGNKYNTGPNYPRYTIGQMFMDLHTSETERPPVLKYNYGDKPLSPTIISPAWGDIINKKDTSSIKFEWTSTGQTNYEFEYSQDNIVWTKLEGTTAKFVNLVTTGLANGDLYARVKIKSNNVWSDYSQTWLLQIGEKPSTPIVSLLGITTSTPTISWNANLLQKMYQVQVLQGSTIIVDSGEIQGTLNQYILKSRLEDNKPYTFKVRIADEYNIWSDWGTKASTVNFIKPPIPTLSLYLNPERGSTIIKIQNPTPGAGEELTVFNDIFRQEGNGEWLRIATNIISEFIDLTIKPKSEIYYKVRAIGQNGYVDSTIKGTEFLMRYSDLSVVGELEKHVKLKYNDRKQQNSGYTGSLLVFSGRNKPVVEFDDSRTNDIALEFEITNKKDLNMLQDIIDSRKTLLYRDSRGRKLYGSVISKLNVQDSEFNYYTVGFTFTETDFNEVV